MKILIQALLLVGVVIPSHSYALDCPTMPEQSKKEWEIEVKAAVGKIGPVKGAELETRTRTATRDLMGKLPQADKLYLEQMMYASYCSGLRDDKALSESEKTIRIRAYNLEVRKTLNKVPDQSQKKEEEGRNKQKPRPQEARVLLSQLSLPYTPETFVDVAGAGDLTAVQLFLDAGMDPNSIKDVHGWCLHCTPLVAATVKGHVSIVKILLDAKPGIYTSNALFNAAGAFGNLEILRLILAAKPDNLAIKSAVHASATYGRRDVLRYLLEKYPDMISTREDYAGDTLLRSAAKNSNPETVIIVLGHGVDVNEKGEDGKTALHEATGRGNVAVVKVLLSSGADVNLKDNEGKIALHFAAEREEVDLARILVDAGSDVNAKCDCPGEYLGGGSMPLIKAAGGSNGSGDSVKLLLDKGADINAATREGVTALMAAAATGNDKNALVLLDRGAKVNARSNNGLTPLMWALRTNRQSDIPFVLDVLLKKGADVNIKDVNGTTPLQLAEEKLNSELKVKIIQTLTTAGAKR